MATTKNFFFNIEALSLFTLVVNISIDSICVVKQKTGSIVLPTPLYYTTYPTQHNLQTTHFFLHPTKCTNLNQLIGEICNYISGPGSFMGPHVQVSIALHPLSKIRYIFSFFIFSVSYTINNVFLSPVFAILRTLSCLYVSHISHVQ